VLKFSNNILKGVRFCLVFPPYQESDDIISIKTMKQGLGKIPPISLCAVAAILEKFGAVVKIVDANVLNLSLADTIREVASFRPDFLGFTVSTYQFHFTLEWIKGIKAHIKVPVFVGGPHVRIYPDEILTHKCIDYCVLGDAEEPLVRLLHCIIEKKDLAPIGGIAYRLNGNVKVNRFSLYTDKLDSVPFPSRHLLNNKLYFSLISKYKNFTAMTSSRGCVFQCTFCDNHYIPHRAMSPKRVVDEMEVCNKEFSVKEIDMFDSIFSVSKRRLADICVEITKRKLDIKWSMRTRVDLVDKDILKLLRASGCMRIYYGIESGSPKVLKNIKKNVSIDQIKYIVKLTKIAGIDTFGFFMIGNLEEDVQTVKETEKLMLALPFDYVQIAPIFYPPNTEIYKELVRVIKSDYWKEYTINPDYRAELPIVGTDFNKRQLHSIVKRMYLKFYCKPRNVIRILVGLKSFNELIRYLKAICSMLGESSAKHKN